MYLNESQFIFQLFKVNAGYKITTRKGKNYAPSINDKVKRLIIGTLR